MTFKQVVRLLMRHPQLTCHSDSAAMYEQTAATLLYWCMTAGTESRRDSYQRAMMKAKDWRTYK
jgi:hypothetical protein